VAAYKSLSRVERAFRSMKTVDLQVRPVFHYSAHRVRAHVFEAGSASAVSQLSKPLRVPNPSRRRSTGAFLHSSSRSHRSRPLYSELLFDASAAQYHNPIGRSDRLRTVRDDDARQGKLANRFVDRALARDI